MTKRRVFLLFHLFSALDYFIFWTETIFMLNLRDKFFQDFQGDVLTHIKYNVVKFSRYFLMSLIERVAKSPNNNSSAVGVIRQTLLVLNHWRTLRTWYCWNSLVLVQCTALLNTLFQLFVSLNSLMFLTAKRDFQKCCLFRTMVSIFWRCLTSFDEVRNRALTHFFVRASSMTKAFEKFGWVWFRPITEHAVPCGELRRAFCTWDLGNM